MTNLEKFLNKDNVKNPKVMEPASGSFKCQDANCEEVVYSGYNDREENRLHWVCSQGHESSVVI